MRHLILLAESFDADPGHIQWERRDQTRWDATFEVGNLRFEVFFKRISGTERHSAWRVDFRRDLYHSERPANIGETTAVLSHIAATVDEFLKEVQPQRLTMAPTGQSHEKLYRAGLKRMMSDTWIRHAYTLDERRYGTLFGEFELNRKPPA